MHAALAAAEVTSTDVSSPDRRQNFTRSLLVMWGALGICSSGWSQEPATEPVTWDIGAEPRLEVLPISSAPMEPVAEGPPVDEGPSGPAVITNGKPAKESRWHVYPSVAVTASFDDNIFIEEQNPDSDWVFTFSPGIAVGVGDFREEISRIGSFGDRQISAPRMATDTRSYLFGHYIPSAQWFLDHTSENSVDHDLLIRGQKEFSRVRVTGVTRAQYLSDADIDVGARTNRMIVDSSIAATYEWSPKLSSEIGFSYGLREYEGGIDSQEWRLPVYLDWTNLSKTRIGLGMVAGYLENDAGLEQTFEQALVRARWDSLVKLVWSGEAGVEWRQTSGAPTDDGANLVFQTGLEYLATESLELQIIAARRISSSASLSDETIESTKIEASVRQRVLDRVYIGLRTGYTHNEYSGNDDFRRVDDYWYLAPGVAYLVTPQASVELGHTFSQNDSSAPGLSFDRNVTNLRFTMSF
jgi:hypothetical protein